MWKIECRACSMESFDQLLEHDGLSFIPCHSSLTPVSRKYVGVYEEGFRCLPHFFGEKTI